MVLLCVQWVLLVFSGVTLCSMGVTCVQWCYFVFNGCYLCSVVLFCVQWVLLCVHSSTILLPVFVFSEDLDRKMDHKRQQIQSGVQEIRALEQRVNQLRDEKVWDSLDPTLQQLLLLSSLYFSCPSVEVAGETAGETGTPDQEGGAGGSHSERRERYKGAGRRHSRLHYR